MVTTRRLSGTNARIHEGVDHYVDEQLAKNRKTISENSEAFATRRDFRLGLKDEVLLTDDLLDDMGFEYNTEYMWGERVTPMDMAAQPIVLESLVESSAGKKPGRAKKFGAFIRKLTSRRSATKY